MPARLLRTLDLQLIALYLLLIILGWLNIYAAVYSPDHSSIFDISQRYGQQLVWMLACVPLVLVILLIDTRFYYVFAYHIFGAIILVLIAVLLFGTVVHGSKSWLAIGAFRVQPAEFAKFATALALAKFMGGRDFRFSDLRSQLGVAIILGLPVLLILAQNDFGSAIVYSTLLLVLYREGMPGWILWYLAFLVLVMVVGLLFDQLYVLYGLIIITLAFYTFRTRNLRATGRLLVVYSLLVAGATLALYFAGLKTPLYLISLAALLLCLLIIIPLAIRHRNRLAFVLALLLAITATASFGEDYVFNNILDNHHQRRINDLLGLEDDPLGWGYNVHQSMIAIGAGGLTGKGYLQGTQTKFNFVPEQSTDFIFCTVGEEWGFLGTLTVVVLFVLLLLKIIQVAERQKEPFHRIYGYAVAAILFFHFAINISMTIGLFPVIGIPLPFFSYGGSSLWAFTVLLFVLVKFDSSRLR
ncbi:MAG: rod shape-determining protein RodA [Bacteroidetes bacterium]|nr:MAG: rod shape-determining protein RodA [Bacteroidota bacterium]